MDNSMMNNDNAALRPKSGLQLRKIGSQYMIVEASDENVNMSSVYNLNTTAARLWKRMEDGTSTVERLADFLCDEYDVDRATALADVQRQVDAWREFGLLG